MIKWGRRVIDALTWVGPWLAALMVLLASCYAAAPNGVEPWEPQEACPTVEVRNNRYEDVVLFFSPLRKRVGTVVGKTKSTFEVCEAVNRDGQFHFHSIGTRRSRDERVTPLGRRVSPGDHLTITIPFALPPYIMGYGGSQEVSELVYKGLTEFAPINLHAGILMDVANCLGLGMGDAQALFSELLWGVADTIIEVRGYDDALDPPENDPRDILLYGAFVPDFVDGRPVIMLQRGYALHPMVVSHEAMHGYGVPEGHPELERCAMRLDPQTEQRYR